MRLSRRGVPPFVAAFPLLWLSAQNPINGIWTQGGRDGLVWQNTRSNGGNPGIAYGVGPSAGYDDCISSVQGQGLSLTKHFTEIRIVKIGGYTPPSTHEVGLWGGLTIGPNSLAGYEFNFQFDANVQPVRSNGPIGNFNTDVFTTLSGAAFAVAHGDIVRSIYDSTSGSPILTLFLNGVQQIQWTDTTAGKILTGYPGMSFFARDGAGLDMTKYCNNRFDCGNA